VSELRVIECPKCRAGLENISLDEKLILCEYCRTPIDLSDPMDDNSNVQNIQVNFSRDISVLLEKGFIFLEENEWEKAEWIFKDVIHSDPKNAQAYLGLLLAETELTKIEELESLNTPLSEKINYRMAIRFVDDDLRQRLERYNEKVEQRIRESQALTQKAAEQTGCLAPLIFSIPVGIVAVELFSLIVGGRFYIINGEILDDIHRFGFFYPWPVYVVFIIVWFLVASIVWGTAHSRKIEKIKVEQSNKE